MLFKAWAVVILIALIVGFVIGLFTGHIKWEKSYDCFGGNKWVKLERVRWWRAGGFNFYYAPRAYGCVEERQYDPDKYHVRNGIIEPIDTVHMNDYLP